MNIADVLHALMEEVTSFCDTNTKLYMLLFADDNSNDTSLYENIAKKRFAGQSLKKDIQAHYCQEANFNDFCEKIELKYLTKANDHSMIYKKLRNLVEECSYFPENHKTSHEYVEIINLQTGEREIIFSTLTAYETLESIQFHPNGNYLLITLGNSCLEYDCTKKVCYKIDTAGENELYIDGCYTDTASPQIQIAIVEHFNYDEPHIEPHCDFYSIHHTPKDSSYRKEWRYYMPTLTRETAKNFLHYSYDIGSGASYTKEEYQTYWCTNGFFLHSFPDDEAFQNIRCSKFNKNRELPLQKSFDKLQMIFCRHDFALANQYRTEKACNNYAYCSDNFSEVIEIFDHSQITYWKNLHTTASSSRYVYDDGENTSDEMSYVSWDTVIPWNEEMLLACYEQYHLMQIKQKGNGILKEIPYKPAISIHGCSFRNVKANQELLENLKNNGAIL